MAEETAPARTCACGCGEPASGGSRYAGTDEAERMRHRARAQYARRRASERDSTRETAADDTLARLGLTDAALPAVAERLAVLAGDLGDLRAEHATTLATERAHHTDALTTARDRAQHAETTNATLTATNQRLTTQLARLTRHHDETEPGSTNQPDNPPPAAPLGPAKPNPA